MSKIFHISDIHIRDGFYEDILHAFKQLCDQLNNHRGSMLVIAGDIFERKTKLDPHDIQCFNKILNMLKESNTETIIIPGNHDYNTNKGGLDLITPLLENNKNTYPNIYCYPQSGIYKHNGINFHVLSPIDKKIPELKITQEPNVAIIHEAIQGSKFDSNAIVQKSRLTLEQLKKYDIALLGDIHKPQFLAPTVAYCGSLIQKHRGEGLDHGYIRWNVKEKSGSFYKMELRRAFITITAYKDKEPDLLELPAREIRLEYQECTEEFVENLIKRIEEKYNKQISHIVDQTPITIDGSNEQTSTINGVEIENEKVNMETVENQLTILDAYLQGIDETEETIEKIKELHIQKTRDFTMTRKHWSLNYLYWDTAYCYGPGNFIDFRKTNGVVPIIGKNMAGKSAILDILLLALFNKGMRGGMGEIPNKYAKQYKVVCSFQVEEDEYVAERSRHGARHSKFILTKNGQNITKGSALETIAVVEKLIGNEKEFKGVVACTQDVELIAAKKGATRINRFHQYLGTAGLAKVAKECVKEIKELSTTIKKLEEINFKIGKSVEKLNESIRDENKIVQQKNNDLQAVEKQLQHQRKIRDKLLLEMPKVVKDYKNRYIEVQKLLGASNELSIDVKTMTKEISSSQKDLQTYSLEKEQLTDMIATLQEQLEYCPDVKDNGEELPTQTEINTKIQELEKKIHPKTTRKTNHPINVLKEKTKTKPTGDLNQLLRKIQHCDINTIQEVPQNLKKYIKDIPNLDKYKTKLTDMKDKLVDVDKTRLQKLKANISKIQKKYKAIDFSDDCSHCQKNKTILVEISGEKTIQESINTMDKQIRNNEKLTITINKYTDRIKNLETVKEIMHNNEIFESNQRLEEQIKLIRDYNDCEHDINQIENDKNRRNLKKYKQMLDIIKARSANENNKQINKEIDELTATRSKLSRKISTALEKIRIYNLLKERDDIKKYAELRKQSHEISKTLDEIEESRKEIYEEKAAATNKIAKMGEQLKMRKENDAEIADKTETVRILTIYSKQCLDSRKGIPFQIMKYALKRIQNNMNQILTEIADFKVKFEFEEEGKTIQLNMKIIERPRHTSVLVDPMAVSSQMASGFQKFVIELAFRLSIIEAIPYFPRFLMVDEGFGKFDKENLEKVKTTLANLFNTKKYGLKFIMIISHLEELQTINGTVIRIKKRRFQDNKDLAGSYVRHGTIPASFPTTQFSELIKNSPVKQAPKKTNPTTNNPDETIAKLTNAQLEQLQVFEEEKIEIKEGKIHCGFCRKALQYKANALERHKNGKAHKRIVLTQARKSSIIPRVI